MRASVLVDNVNSLDLVNGDRGIVLLILRLLGLRLLAWFGQQFEQTDGSVFVGDRVAASQIGIGVNGGSQIRQPDAAWAAVLAGACYDHFLAEQEQLIDILESLFTVAQSTRIPIVENDRGPAEVLAVHDAADVSAIAHGDHRQRYDGQVS